MCFSPENFFFRLFLKSPRRLALLARYQQAPCVLLSHSTPPSFREKEKGKEKKQQKDQRKPHSRPRKKKTPGGKKNSPAE